MRRFRPLVVALALVFVAFTAVPAPAQSTTDALNQRVEALEKRIATLEQMLAQRLTAIEQKMSQPQAQAQQPNPQEQAAIAAYGQINQLVASGDYDKARASMVEFMKTYPTTRLRGHVGHLQVVPG